MSPSWLLASQRTVTCWGLKKVSWLRTWLVLRASVTLVWMLSSSGSAVSRCHKAVWLLHLQVGRIDADMAVKGQSVTRHFTSAGDTHLSMLSQLCHCMMGVGTPSATHVTRCFFPGRWWSVSSLIWAGTTDTDGKIYCHLNTFSKKNKLKRDTWIWKT